MPESSPAPRKTPGHLLRRADQLTVAVLVLAGLGATAAWWIAQGGLQGRLLELDRAVPQVARFRVDLNHAAWPELAQIPGLGEALSRRIVDYRAAHGPFRDLTQVQEVRGIGPKIYDAIRPYLFLTAESPATKPQVR